MHDTQPYVVVLFAAPADDGEYDFIQWEGWIKKHCQHDVSVWSRAFHIGDPEPFYAPLERFRYRGFNGNFHWFTDSWNIAIDRLGFFRNLAEGWRVDLEFRFTDPNEAMRFKLQLPTSMNKPHPPPPPLADL